MINERKSTLKRKVLLIIILFISVVIGIISIAKKYTPEEAIAASRAVPITVKSWVEKQAHFEYKILRQYSHPSLGKNPTITYNDLITQPNLYCSAKGVPLSSQPGAIWEREGPYDATPAEAWVLAESDKNVSGGTSDGAWKVTTKEYVLKDGETLEEVDSSKFNVHGVVYKVVGDVGEEKYVVKGADGKYYCLEYEGGSAGGDGTYSYVQYAWWQVCTRAENRSAIPDKSAGLKDEALDFEKYVAKMSGGSGSGDSYNWPKNEDGTFKINYDVELLPDKKEDLKVVFNAETNKYVVGPINIVYERQIVKHQERVPVDFCGISGTILVGVDEEGNELLDSEGESVFVQNENYRLVYADQALHDSLIPKDADGNPLDTAASYPYPYSGEDFYIEVDYLDDLYELKSFKVDFYYMTGKGSYEMYKGYIREDDDDKPQQKQTNATGPNELKLVDAGASGKGESGVTPVELEIMNWGNLPLYTSLGGMVWIDHDEQKDAAKYGRLGIYDEGENTADTPAPENSVEILVWKVKYQISGSEYKEIEREKAIAWKKLDGKDENKIDFINNRVYIDKDGKYKIPIVQIPSEEGLDTSKYRIAYDVEFIYDGQTYEATEFLVEDSDVYASGTSKEEVFKNKLAAFYKTEAQTAGAAKDYTTFAKSSYAVENASKRRDFDLYFLEVYGGNPIDTEKIKEQDSTDYYYEVATKGYATGGIGVNSQFGRDEYGLGVGNREVVPVDLEYNARYVSNDASGETKSKTKSQLITHDKDGYVYDKYRFGARVTEGGLLLPYEGRYHVEPENYDNIEMNKLQYKPVTEYLNQVNLGLLERYHSDVSIMKDLYVANVVVNEHLSTYRYNKLGKLTDEALSLQETLGYREQTYAVNLYNSDFYYRSAAYTSIEDTLTKKLVTAIKDDTELQLFLTYRIQLTNESVNMNASINEFKDYYDSTFKLITNEVCNSTEDGNDAVKDGTTDADGKFQKYITSIKAAGSDTDTEVSRELRTVAYSPYYRKLTNRPNPAADSTATEEQPNPKTTDYYWNRDDDISKEKVSKVETAAKNIIVAPGKDEGGYHTFTYNGLAPIESIKKGKLPNDDPLVIEPGETIEVFVSYQVDVEGFKKATQETEEDMRENTTKNPEETVRKNLLGVKSNIVEITSYTTGYNFLQTADGKTERHSTVTYSNGNISGRIDQDSAPDNINIEKVKENQDEGFKHTEDDAEFAPKTEVTVKKIEDHRTLNGVVWEDSRDDNGQGDGIYTPKSGDNPGETGINDIDVTMVEKIRLTKADLENKGYDIKDLDPNIIGSIIDNEFEYVWKEGQIPDYKAKTVSAKQGEEDGYYEFKNFPTGTFVVRFEYGNDYDKDVDLKYNGQDYKNASYQTGMKNPTKNTDNVPSDVNEKESTDMKFLAGKSTLNNEWHDLSKNDEAEKLENTRVSDARDYEPQRIRVIAYSRTITNHNAEVLASNIQKSITTKEDTANGFNVKEHATEEYQGILGSEDNRKEFVANTRMVANTAKLYIDVEKQDQITYKTIGDTTVPTTSGDQGQKGSGTTKHEYIVANIDFGLVERPETRINIRKEIAALQLLKNDGKEPILSVTFDDNGDIIKDGSGDSAPIKLEKVTEIEKKKLGESQGFKYIAMEKNLLNGLQVKIRYKIDVTNNSEVDYVGGTLAGMKNIEKIYRLADNYENEDTERLYATEEAPSNTVPFISGKGIIYGRYLGTYYYTNKYDIDGGNIETAKAADKTYSAMMDGDPNKVYERYGVENVVKTTVDQVVDYIDNDLSIDLSTTRSYENQVWVPSKTYDRKNKLSEVSYRKGETDDKYEKTEEKLQDDKQRQYVTMKDGEEVNNNIYLSRNETMKEQPEVVKYTRLVYKDTTMPVPEKEATDKTVDTGTVNPETGEVENKKPLKFVTFETTETTIDYLYTSKSSLLGEETDLANTLLTKPLVPHAYKEKHADNTAIADNGTIWIVTTAEASEEGIDRMNYDNLTEIVMYSNSVGRRDMQTIPGNANMIAKDFKAYQAGYNRYVPDENKPNEYVWKAKTVEYTDASGNVKAKIYTERDAYAARDTVTFSEPTGITIERKLINTVVNTLLTILMVAALGVAVTIVILMVKKNTYDDKDIVNAKNKN